MAKTTVYSLANEIYQQLEIRNYKGQEDRYFFKDGSPEWMKNFIVDALYKASTDLDTGYAMANRVLGALADCCDDESDENDYREAISEIEPDVYTSELTSWLNSSNKHVHYLDEALSEFGGELDGFQVLSIAQKLQIEEIGGLLLQELLALAEDSDEDTQEIEITPENQ